MDINLPVFPSDMPIVVGKIEVKVNDKVVKDQVLANIETSKGTREIKATCDGVVKEIAVNEGDVVKTRDLLFIIDETTEESAKLLEEKNKDTGFNEENVDMIADDTPIADTEVTLPVFPSDKPIFVGTIEKNVGDSVATNDVILNVETSKGKREIKSPIDGQIKKILVNTGDVVKTRDLLFTIGEISNQSYTGEVKKDVFDKGPLKEGEKSSEPIKTELLVIGGGPGGYVAAIYAAKNGMDVTLVEKHKLGGSCLNWGCIPTKAILHSAEAYTNIKNADKLGITVTGDVDFDYEKVIANKDRVVNELVSGIDYLVEKKNIRLIRGLASFIDDHHVKVAETTIEAEKIIIATGSKSARINIPGINLEGVIDAKEALSDTDFPESITIIGAGVMGLEFAFLYNEFGAKVHVIEYLDHILNGTDKDAADFIFDIAKEKGIKISLAANITEIKKTEDGQMLTYFKQDGQEKIALSQIILSTTSTPANVDGLGIENTSIEFDGKIIVDKHMKTNLDHIYAIGDVTKIFQLAHVASHQGIMAVDHMMGKDVEEFEIRKVPSVIYTHPEIAAVGFSEGALKELGIDYDVTKIGFGAIGRAVIDSAGQGFAKLMMDKESHEILGAVLVGHEVSNLVTDFTIAIENKLKVEDIAKTIYSHPTTGEIIHELAMKILGYGIHD